MDLMNASYPDVRNVGVVWTEGNPEEVEDLWHQVDEIFTKVNTLEKQVNEVEQFHLVNDNSSIVKDKETKKHLTSLKKQQQDTSCREAPASKSMQELMRQFATILHQMTQHRWAWPFMKPVDVEKLGLHDYYEVIKKPMDFSTIEKKMEDEDGTGYKNVREIYADVRLVFKNAMKYNDEKDYVHVMAKRLLEKFEEKWLQLLPKVAEEEERRAGEDAEARLSMQVAQEVAYANMARDLSNELYEFDMHLKNLKEMVVRKFRKMSTVEKKNLGTALTQLSPEELSRALEIVAETNPSFEPTAQEVDLDMDAQSEYTLRSLKVFVKDSLKVHGRSSGGISGNNNDRSENIKKNNSKRRREICDALAKTAVKRTKKLSNL